MSAHNPVSNLPLWAAESTPQPQRPPCACGRPYPCPTHTQSAPGLRALFAPPRPLTERGKARASEASDRLPAFVLEALGDALQALRGHEFSFEQVRLRAEAESPSVRDWLAVASRRNVLGGWTRSRIKLFDLRRVGDVPAVRDARRGARSTLWRFPSAPEA